MVKKISCSKCGKEYTTQGIRNHELYCKDTISGSNEIIEKQIKNKHLEEEIRTKKTEYKYYCGACGYEFNDRGRYCMNCGGEFE